MKVGATSSLREAGNLTATFFYGTTELPAVGKTMTYSDKKNKWSVTFDSNDGLDTTKPDKVKVCSPDTCVETLAIDGRQRRVESESAPLCCI